MRKRVCLALFVAAFAAQYAAAQSAAEELFNAIRWNDPERVALLLRENRKLVLHRDSLHHTPLHYAACGSATYALGTDTTEIAIQLIKAGADIHARGNMEQTPLHLAASCDRRQLVALLLERGADINAVDTYGRTPLDKAVFPDHRETAEILIAHGALINAWNAAALGNTEVLARVLEEDPSLVNGFRKAERSLLEWAGMRRQREAVKLLLEKGATLDLWTAALTGQRDYVSAAVQLNPDAANAANRLQESPLLLATRGGQLQMIEFLLNHGADPNLRPGSSPIHEAVRYGDRRAVEVLLAHGADPSGGSKPMLSPYRLALRLGYTDIANLLKVGK